jgi:DNA-binding response OmpR family regulator
MEGGQHLALEAGADDYLPKPIDTRARLHKINGLLTPRREDEP